MCNLFFILESLRRKDEIIKQALIEKQELIESLLHIPQKNLEDVKTDSDGVKGEKEPLQLIVNAIEQGM